MLPHDFVTNPLATIAFDYSFVFWFVARCTCLVRIVGWYTSRDSLRRAARVQCVKLTVLSFDLLPVTHV